MTHKLPDPILAPLFFIDSSWDQFDAYHLKTDTSSKKPSRLIHPGPAPIEIIHLKKEDLLSNKMGRYLK